MPAARCNSRSSALAAVGHLRRPPRPAGRADESGRRAAVDSLARPAHSRAAGGRQRLLHGLSVHAAADARPPLAARRPAVAALAAQQMAGGRAGRALPLELRSVRPVGQPVVDRLDRHRLLRRGVRRRQLLPRRGVLQIRLPDRPVQLRAVARLAAGSRRPRAGRLRDVHARRSASAAARPSPAASCTSSSRASMGNLDCTFCLDCVHACPHDNVGILAAVPGRTLWSDPFRSGIGRFSRRPDLAALVAGARLRRVRQCGRHGRARRRVARSLAAARSAIRRNWRSRPRAISLRSSCCRWSPSRLPPPSVAAGPRSAIRRSRPRPALPLHWCRSASACGSPTTVSTSSPVGKRSSPPRSASPPTAAGPRWANRSGSVPAARSCRVDPARRNPDARLRPARCRSTPASASPRRTPTALRKR